MGRLDRELVSLKAKLQEARTVGIPGDVESIQKRITSREKQLLPLYTQIATRFAELHDTSLRMAAKGVINKVVVWESSRSFFYKRLHRRVSEGSLIRIVRDAAGEQLPQKSALELIKKWFLAFEPAELAGSKWEDDDAFFAWKDDPKNFEKYLKELQVQKVLLQLSSIGESASDLQALPQGLAALLSKMDSSSRAQITEELKQVLGQY